MEKKQKLHLIRPKNMRHIKMNFGDEKEVKEMFKEPPFYKTFI